MFNKLIRDIRVNKKRRAGTLLIVFIPNFISLIKFFFSILSESLDNVGIEINTRGIIATMKVKISTVDATKIALNEGILVAGIAVVNTIMLGAVARATKVVTIESVKKAIRKGLVGLPDKVIETNVAAAQRAYDELKMGYSL